MSTVRRFLPAFALSIGLASQLVAPVAGQERLVTRGPDDIVKVPVVTRDAPARLVAIPSRETYLLYEPVEVILSLEILIDGAETSWPRYMIDRRTVFFSVDPRERVRYWWAPPDPEGSGTLGTQWRRYPNGTRLEQSLPLGSTMGNGVYHGCPTGYVFGRTGEFKVWVQHGVGTPDSGPRGKYVESTPASFRVVEPQGDDALVAKRLEEILSALGASMDSWGGATEDRRLYRSEFYDLLREYPDSRYSPYLRLFLASGMIKMRKSRLPPYPDGMPDDAPDVLLREILERHRDDPGLRAVVDEAEYCQAMLIRKPEERKAALERFLEREDHLFRFFLERERDEIERTMASRGK